MRDNDIFILVVVFVIGAFMGSSYCEDQHRNDTLLIKQQQESITRMESDYQELNTKYIKLQADYAALEREVQSMLVDDLAKEAIWNVFGLGKYQILCRIAKIKYPLLPC